jgi:hypothetical protein
MHARAGNLEGHVLCMLLQVRRDTGFKALL